jgi:hypothetical protein
MNVALEEAEENNLTAVKNLTSYGERMNAHSEALRGPGESL